MIKIIFLTSGPIDYSLPGLDLYESLEKTSLGLVFPGLKKGARTVVEKKLNKLNLKAKSIKILSASSLQAKQTAAIISQRLGEKAKIEPRLDAIAFDFKRIITKKEFTFLGDKAFDIARPRFLKSFFNNQLLETKFSVKRRIDSFFKEYLKESKESAENPQTILAISHSFLMMIIRAYLLAGKKVFEDYSLLRKFCCFEKRPFSFLDGFQVVLK